jgi:hypothetical protein
MTPSASGHPRARAALLSHQKGGAYGLGQMIRVATPTETGSRNGVAAVGRALSPGLLSHRA